MVLRRRVRECWAPQFRRAANREFQSVSSAAPELREGTYRASVGSDHRAKGGSIMFSRIDPTVLAIRGTLAGDLLWLATVAFLFAIITGMLG
jgi:hypothetical protein